MSSYDPALFAIELVTATTRAPLDAAAVTVSSGYSVEDGKLIVDPAQGTVAISQRLPYPLDVTFPAGVPPRRGDRVEVTYAGVVQGRFLISDVDVAVAVDPKRQTYDRTTTLALTGLEVLLAGDNAIEYVSLPAESQLVRLRRAFVVSTSLLSPADVTALHAMVAPAEEEETGVLQSKTRLQFAREFSLATGWPVRPVVTSAWQGPPTTLEIFPVPVANLPDASFWISAAELDVGSTATAPTSLSVVKDDTRLSGGLSSSAGPVKLGVNARLPFLIGTAQEVVGMRAPARITSFGLPGVVTRVTQTYSATNGYSASVELMKVQEE